MVVWVLELGDYGTEMRKKWDCGDSLINNVPAAQSQGPEFKSPTPVEEPGPIVGL